MTNRFLIPVPGLGLLALPQDAFTEALAAGSDLARGLAPSPALVAPEPLLNANHAAAQLGVTARWLEDSARAGIIPYHKLGRFIRFRASEIAAQCRVEGALLVSPTDNQSVTPFRKLSRQ